MDAKTRDEEEKKNKSSSSDKKKEPGLFETLKQSRQKLLDALNPDKK